MASASRSRSRGRPPKPDTKKSPKKTPSRPASKSRKSAPTPATNKKVVKQTPRGRSTSRSRNAAPATPKTPKTPKTPATKKTPSASRSRSRSRPAAPTPSASTKKVVQSQQRETSRSRPSMSAPRPAGSVSRSTPRTIRTEVSPTYRTLSPANASLNSTFNRSPAKSPAKKASILGCATNSICSAWTGFKRNVRAQHMKNKRTMGQNYVKNIIIWVLIAVVAVLAYKVVKIPAWRKVATDHYESTVTYVRTKFNNGYELVKKSYQELKPEQK